MTECDPACVWVLAGAEPDTSSWDVLSGAEQDRAARFLLDRDRASFVLAHALTRLALSRCEPRVAPNDWTFAIGQFGRPEISGPIHTRLRFNLSHAPGAVACIVATSDCGVDIEPRARTIDVERLCRAWLTPDELRFVIGLHPARRAERFIRHWTVKEAYAKARGLGMNLPFDRVGIHWAACGRPQLRIDSVLADDAADWHLEQREVGLAHIASAVVRRTVQPQQVIWRTGMPEPVHDSDRGGDQTWARQC